jgi:DNA-binding FadR family transcriptional regulator
MCHDDGQASSCELVDHGERWLLMAHDRVEGDEVLMTHEFLALMLGVRRAGVTGALQHFEMKGMVETARGAVTVKDREALRECANGLG